MSRRVISKSTIDELVAAGTTECHVGPNDIVTDLAAEHAQDRGVRLVRDGAGSAPEPDRAQVRRAVITALGAVPDGLDAVIDKVMEN